MFIQLLFEVSNIGDLVVQLKVRASEFPNCYWGALFWAFDQVLFWHTVQVIEYTTSVRN